MEEKLWVDLTEAEKIERLHEVVKIIINNHNLLNTEMTRLKLHLNQMQNKETGWF